MELRKYIEEGEKKAGSQKELAKFLGITTGYIRNAKANKSGLPDVICIKLADYIKEDPLKVIAASNLVTEKDEEKRKIFESCFNRAASIATAAIVISILTLPINKPVNAQEISGNLPFYKLSAIERRIRNRRKGDSIGIFLDKIRGAFQREDFVYN